MNKNTVKSISRNNGGKGKTNCQKRLLLFRKQKGTCSICNEQMGFQQQHGQNAATLDHILPKSKGGNNRITNLRVVHRKCNGIRGNSLNDILVEAAGMWALRWNIKELP